MAQNAQLTLMKLAGLYATHFGHGIPMAILQSSVPTEELNEMLQQALDSGKEIPGWAGQPASCIVDDTKPSVPPLAADRFNSHDALREGPAATDTKSSAEIDKEIEQFLTDQEQKQKSKPRTLAEKRARLLQALLLKQSPDDSPGS